MKKTIIYLILIVTVIPCNAQSTWFKFLNGFTALDSRIINDTLYSFGSGDRSFLNYFTLIQKVDMQGNLLRADSFNFEDSFFNSYARKNCVIKQNNLLYFAVTNVEKINSSYPYRTYLYSNVDFKQQPIEVNFDTSSTFIQQIELINGIQYIIINPSFFYSKDFILPSFFLAKIVKDSVVHIKHHINTISSSYNHSFAYNKLYEDNQTPSNLLLSIVDAWDFQSSYQNDIVKLDTNGNELWRSRPNLNWDSTNTTGFQMVQKPNGNILCCWLDMYYRPHKRPDRDYQYEDIKSDATLWFAEIEYETGKVLWNKNIRQYLGWKLSPSDIAGRVDMVDLLANDALAVDDGIIWGGHRSRTYQLTNSWKRLPFLLKTDFNGNPLWYREYDFYPSDTGDKGMQVYSFIQTPDKGFILTGEYQNVGGQLTNGKLWQKGCILKVDSNGCFEPGCDKADRVIKINAPQNLCTVYPNPANNDIYIQYPINTADWQASVMDMTGKLLLETKGSNINTLNLPNGNYQLILKKLKNYHYETHQITIHH